MARSRKTKKRTRRQRQAQAETKRKKRRTKARARESAPRKSSRRPASKKATKRAARAGKKKPTRARAKPAATGEKKKTRARAKPAATGRKKPVPSKRKRTTGRRPPPPKKKRAPRRYSGKEWERRLTDADRRAIDRARLAFETGPAQTSAERRREYERRREAYARALRRTNATEASIRARIAIAERRRFDIRNLRDALVGATLDAAGYKGDWRVLNNLQKNLDPSFVEFITQMEALGYDYDTAVDFWYSPEAGD